MPPLAAIRVIQVSFLMLMGVGSIAAVGLGMGEGGEEPREWYRPIPP
ncbi:MAG: hypothetical protein Fur0042_14250 [Cyanophyceae cyanobacterium]